MGEMSGLGRWILILVCWLVSGVVCAMGLQVRDTSITVKFYGVDEGLPSPDVTSIYRDSFGLMWIGTSGGGLSCFDGSVCKSV